MTFVMTSARQKSLVAAMSPGVDDHVERALQKVCVQSAFEMTLEVKAYEAARESLLTNMRSLVDSRRKLVDEVLELFSAKYGDF